MCSCYGDIKAVNYEYHDILQGRDTFHKHWSEDQFRAALHKERREDEDRAAFHKERREDEDRAAFHKERREDEDRAAFFKDNGFKYSKYMYLPITPSEQCLVTSTPTVASHSSPLPLQCQSSPTH